MAIEPAPGRRAAVEDCNRSVTSVTIQYRRMHHRWLLIRMETLGTSPSLSLDVWRSMRALGARYVHESVCVLPDRPETVEAVERLAARIRRKGAELRVFNVGLPSDAERAALVERFCAERSDEYAEVVARTREFLDEIAMERRRGRAIYTEVEESQADLRRFERWLKIIRARDYFDAPGHAEAAAAVQACKDALAEFEADAYSHETAGDPAAQAVALRVGTGSAAR
jgi:hypothetical protein